MTTIEIKTTTRIATEDCYACGTTFGMTEGFKQARLADHKTFYCPNGHGQMYTGKSEAEKLREQLEKAEARRQFWEAETNRAREARQRAERQASAARGQVTKLKNRAAGGVCPCCNRSFVQLQRHMATKHPDFAAVDNPNA